MTGRGMTGGGEMRPITALAFEALSPGASLVAEPVFEWRDPASLLVDEAYQRQLSAKSLKLIRQIVETWSWARFKPPVVAQGPDGLEVIDGQHTAIAAATHPGIGMIPVMIVQAPGVEDRAGAFLGHNRDRLAMSPVQIHRAALAAADPDALAAEAVASAAGLRLLAYTPAKNIWRPGDCVAFTTLYALIVRRGPTRATAILKVLAGANLAPVTAWQILSVERLLCHAEYAAEVTAAGVAEAILEFGPDLARQVDIAGAEHRLTRERAMTLIVFRRASRGRRRVV